MVRRFDQYRVAHAMGWALAAALLTTACASPPPPPAHTVSSAALALESQPRLDEIDCSARNCIHWYTIDVPRSGSLRLSLETFEPAAAESSGGLSFFSGGGSGDASNAVFELAIADGLGAPLGSIEGRGYETRVFDARVARGSYLVSVRTSDDKARMGYRLKHSFKAAPKKRVRRPKPPPKPRYAPQAATILEFEGWGSDVEAVLIDLGSTRGVKKGMRGHFVQEGEKLGRIIVTEVYPEGSRATVEGGLDRPLGSDASVEILFPLN